MLCMQEARQEVRRTVERIEGLALTGSGGIGCAWQCMELLGKTKYQYVEVDVRVPSPEYLASRAGLYRYRLAESAAPECEDYRRLVDKDPTIVASREKRFGIPSSSCVVAAPIQAAQADYQYEARRETYMELLGISKNTETLSDRRSGEIVATSTAFSRINGWLLALTGMNPGPHQVCRPYESSLHDRIETILKPA